MIYDSKHETLINDAGYTIATQVRQAVGPRIVKAVLFHEMLVEALDDLLSTEECVCVEAEMTRGTCSVCRYKKLVNSIHHFGQAKLRNVGIIVVLLIALHGMAAAWEKPGNPDRYPSIGLEASKGQIAGIPRQGVNGDQTNGGTVGFVSDLRFPMTDSLTLHASFQNDGINNNLNFTDGYRLAFGLRVYLRD